MEKFDLLILAGAGALAATAGVLWFTREPSITLEDAPPVARQMVAESADPRIRAAIDAAGSTRLTALKPSPDVPVFKPVRPDSADDAVSTDAEKAARTMQDAADRANAAAASAAEMRR